MHRSSGFTESLGRCGVTCSRDDLLPYVTHACPDRARAFSGGRMFPSVRLMVAAIFASIVVLVFGFGMFAAFRVSHEPFARLPPATSPLQLVADNTAVSPLAFAPREPFERRLQLGELPNFPPA